MAALVYRLEFKVFTRILQEIPTEVIRFKPLKRHLQLLKIAPIKWLVIWCLICQIWALKEIFNLSNNFSKIRLSVQMVLKSIQHSLFEEQDSISFGKMENIEIIIPINSSRLLHNFYLWFHHGSEYIEFKEIFRCL